MQEDCDEASSPDCLYCSRTCAVVCSSSCGRRSSSAASGPSRVPSAYQNEQMQQGAERAIADLNDVGGVLGQTLTLMALDDACDSGQGVAAAQRRCHSSRDIMSGRVNPGCQGLRGSQCCSNFASLDQPSADGRGAGQRFRVCGRDDQQGAIAGTYLAQRWRDAKIAILNDGSVCRKGLADETKRHLNARGVSEVLYETLTPGLGDYSTVVAKLKAAGVRTAYLELLSRGGAGSPWRTRSYDLQFVSGSARYRRIRSDRWERRRRNPVHVLRDPRRNSAADAIIDRFNTASSLKATPLATQGVEAWAQAVSKAGTTGRAQSSAL